MTKKEMKKYLEIFGEYNDEKKEALKIISNSAKMLIKDELDFELVNGFRKLVEVRNKFSYMKFVLIENCNVEEMSDIESLADELIQSVKNQMVGLIFNKTKSELSIAKVDKFEKYAGILEEDNVNNFINEVYNNREPAKKIDKRQN